MLSYILIVYLVVAALMAFHLADPYQDHIEEILLGVIDGIENMVLSFMKGIGQLLNPVKLRHVAASVATIFHFHL